MRALLVLKCCFSYESPAHLLKTNLLIAYYVTNAVCHIVCDKGCPCEIAADVPEDII